MATASITEFSRKTISPSGTGTRSGSKTHRKKQLSVKGKIDALANTTTKVRWQRAQLKIATQFRLNETVTEKKKLFKFVQTEPDVKMVFDRIEKYLQPKWDQDTYMVIVGFEGKEISRKGDVNLVTLTIQDKVGVTWIIDAGALRDTFWTTAKPFFSSPYVEKIVFDGKHMADYLLHTHGYELRGMYDLMVMEAMERGMGNVRAAKPLPLARIVPNVDETEEDKMDKSMFLDQSLVECYYLEADGQGGKEKRKTRGKSMKSMKRKFDLDSQIEDALDFQRFMMKFCLKFNFEEANVDKTYLRWWVSSERYCALLSEKTVRLYNEIETSHVIPNNIMCLDGTDQPLGIVRCVKCDRLLPTRDYTFEMLSLQKPPACRTCIYITKKIYTRSGNLVLVKNTHVTIVVPPSGDVANEKTNKTKRGGTLKKKTIKKKK